MAGSREMHHKPIDIGLQRTRDQMLRLDIVEGVDVSYINLHPMAFTMFFPIGNLF